MNVPVFDSSLSESTRGHTAGRHRSGLALFEITLEEDKSVYLVGATPAQLDRLGLRPDRTYESKRLKLAFFAADRMPVWLFAQPAGEGLPPTPIGRIFLVTSEVTAVEQYRGSGSTARSILAAA